MSSSTTHHGIPVNIVAARKAAFIADKGDSALLFVQSASLSRTRTPHRLLLIQVPPLFAFLHFSFSHKNQLTLFFDRVALGHPTHPPVASPAKSTRSSVVKKGAVAGKKAAKPVPAGGRTNTPARLPACPPSPHNPVAYCTHAHVRVVFITP